jgi:tetratricopeptide (TPR) repeat protein
LQPGFAAAHNNWGIALMDDGRCDEAVEHFRKATELDPNYHDARKHLGIAQARAKRPDDALASWQEAVRRQPNSPDVHLNLAHLHRDQGRFDEALAAYHKVLSVTPSHLEARLQVASVLSRQGKIDQAISGFQDCLLYHRDRPDVWNDLGVLLAMRDRFDDAVAAFRAVLDLRADHADALTNLGNTLLKQDKGEEALGYLRQAVSQRPGHPQPHSNLGAALVQLGKADEAVVHFHEALKLDPEYVDALFHLGGALRTLGRPEESIPLYEKILLRQPDNHGARLNLGIALNEVGRLDESSEAIQEVMHKQPAWTTTWSCLGVVRMHQGRIEEAIELFSEAGKREPENADFHLNRALCWLLLGRFDLGWPEYEWRFKAKKGGGIPYAQPMWDGSPLPGGSILLWAEQGLGDTIQFIRYAPLVKERVSKVVFVCPVALRGLFGSVRGIDELIVAGQPVPACDVQAPLLSLPRILGTTLESIPGGVPYMCADAALRQTWSERIGHVKGLKVGIVWQGNPHFSGDRYRSVRLTHFRPLAQVPGVKLFSLQVGKGSEQLNDLQDELQITDVGQHISGDFRETAGALANMDLVISVDSCVAHLSGAMGLQTWVLLPFNNDWRWLSNRSDSVWYPSATLFRQERWGDWPGVFERVAVELRRQARRPLLQAFPVRLGLVELIERAVGEELCGNLGDGCSSLRQSSLCDTPEVARLQQDLKSLHQVLDSLDRDMQVVGNASDIEPSAAVELLVRYAHAQKERASAVERFSSWLSDGDALPEAQPPLAVA